jgi:glycosyltransferase involved in cell wall biosynthesis
MVGAQRPAQFAKHLTAFGWRAIVLCCDATRRGTARPEDRHAVAEEARAALRGSDPNASVVIPTPSLAADGAIDRFWRANESARPGSARAAVRKALTGLKLWTGDYSQAWQPCARWAAAVVASATGVDACIGEHSPDAGLFLARWFSRAYRVPWVADFRDPILQPLSPLTRRIYRPHAKRLVGTAAATINVNRIWAGFDRDLFGLPAYVLPNGYDPDEFPARGVDRPSDRFTIAYMGNIIPEQKVEPFVEGLARVKARLGPESSRCLRFVYRGFSSERIRRLADEHGVDEIIDAGAPIARELAIAALQQADLLLLLSIAEPERQEVWYRNGLHPAKVFECFGAGRPILCVPGDRGLLDDLLEETQTGVVARSPDEVADYLVDALADWKEGRPPEYRPVEARIRRYTRHHLAGRLAELLDSVVAGTRPAPVEQELGAHPAGAGT